LSGSKRGRTPVATPDKSLAVTNRDPEAHPTLMLRLAQEGRRIMAHTHAHRARLQVEHLEDRQLLAGHITFNAVQGIVNVQGTPLVSRVLVPAIEVGGLDLVRHGATNAARLSHRHASPHATHRATNAAHHPRRHASAPANPPGVIQSPTRGADGLTADEELILQQTNATRAARGLPALVVNPLLQQAAEARAQAEANTNTYYGDGGFPGDITVTGYNWSTLGQNDAYNWGYGAPAQQLMNQWLASPPHLANIVNGGYVEVGIAVATGPSGSTFGVQCFGAPA
jgi:uncharacterized protein YkwD